MLRLVARADDGDQVDRRGMKEGVLGYQGTNLVYGYRTGSSTAEWKILQ